MTETDPDSLLGPAGGYFALVEDGALTGCGLGRRAVGAGLDFGRREFAPSAFRVSVATSNRRALRVVESLGFHRVARFEASADRRSFEMLVREAGRTAR